MRVNKKRIAPSYKLQIADLVRVPPIRVHEKPTQQIKPPSLPNFEVLFEDKSLLIINKPAGIAVHGGSGVSYGIIEQIRAHQAHDTFLELVHRLDRETSGILMLAKKRSALVKLQQQLRDHQIDKRYLTLVQGDWQDQQKHVRLPLYKYVAANDERRVKVDKEKGLASHTFFVLQKKWTQFALLEAHLKTGRTHQIRVHLASLGFPIVGDSKYGNFALNHQLRDHPNTQLRFQRMFLHAYLLCFKHPDSEENITITAPLPPECINWMEHLGPIEN